MATEEHLLRAHAPQSEHPTGNSRTQPGCVCTLCWRRSRELGGNAIHYLCSWWTRRARWSLRSLLLSWRARGTRRRSGGWGLWCRCSWRPFSRCDSCARSGPANAEHSGDGVKLWTWNPRALPKLSHERWVTAMEFSKYILRAPAAGLAQSP